MMDTIAGINEDFVNEKISEVIDALSESAEWPPVGEVEIRFVASSGEIEESTPVDDLSLLSEEIEKEISESLTELRELMLDPQAGYWELFTLRVTGTTGEFEVSFGYGVTYEGADALLDTESVIDITGTI